MGFATRGGEFCRRLYITLDSIENCVVDNILLWDSDCETHFWCIHNMQCLNAELFSLTVPSVVFCGYRLSQKDIATDKKI